MTVDTCVIPCAGLGTRLRPLSLVVPKELLPWGRRPLLEHLWSEMWEAGIRKFIVILRPGKEIIRHHLEAAGLEACYVEQSEPLGQADALRTARSLVDGPFVMGLPDQQLATGTAQLLSHYQGQDSLSSMVEVDRPEYFPGASAFKYEGSGPRYRVLGIGREEGLLRAFGRTVYSREFLDTIPEKTHDASFGQIFLDWIKSGRHEAVVLQGTPADLGTLDAYVHYQKTPPCA
jgi:NDP-sugar pyrophosphorylase family protein